jgi:hypothetical protein
MIALELAHIFDQEIRFDLSGAAAHHSSARLTEQHRFHLAESPF